jgi:phosphoribosylformylglycinamidine cyclo-ligase
MGRPPQSCKDAGVDIERGNAPVERMKPLAQGTVGTKQKLTVALDGHNAIGIRPRGHVRQRRAVQGAEPLFFLDYVATGRIDVEVATRVPGRRWLAGRPRRCRTSTPRGTMTSPASASGW